MKLSELISGPNTWTQGAPARDRLGLPVRAKNNRAVCWCLWGGLHYICLDASTKERIKFIIASRQLEQSCLRLYGTSDYTMWQDLLTTTWEQVQALIADYENAPQEPAPDESKED